MENTKLEIIKSLLKEECHKQEHCIGCKYNTHTIGSTCEIQNIYKEVAKLV